MTTEERIAALDLISDAALAGGEGVLAIACELRALRLMLREEIREAAWRDNDGELHYDAHRMPTGIAPVLSVDQAASVLGINRATLYRLLRDGELQAVRVGKRLKFRPEDLDAYLEPIALRKTKP